jgi:hypothetical protein
MVDPLTAFGFATSIIAVADIGFEIVDTFRNEIVRVVHLMSWYGPSGLVLFLFGSRTTWRMQAQVLGQLKEEDALGFKKSVYDECTMVSVAVRVHTLEALHPLMKHRLQL